jgi:hypothetical protein
VQVHLREAFGHQIEQAGLGEAVELRVELESFEDIADCRLEGLSVSEQVLPDVVLVAHQLLHVHR